MSLGIVSVTSRQPRGIIIPTISEKLPFKLQRKALAMPLGQNDGEHITHLHITDIVTFETDITDTELY